MFAQFSLEKFCELLANVNKKYKLRLGSAYPRRKMKNNGLRIGVYPRRK